MSILSQIKRARFAIFLQVSRHFNKYELQLEEQDTDDTGNIQVDYLYHLQRRSDTEDLVEGSLRVTDRYILIRYIETLDKTERRKGLAAATLSMLIDRFPGRKVAAVYPKPSAKNFWMNLHHRIGSENVAESMSLDEMRVEVREYVERTKKA